MEDFFAKFNPGELIGFVAVVGGFLSGMLAIVMNTWYYIRKAEIAAALKRDMLNRGMSADEIRTVVEAGSKRSRKDRPKAEAEAGLKAEAGQQDVVLEVPCQTASRR